MAGGGGEGVKAVPAICVDMAPRLFSKADRDPARIVPTDYFRNWVGVQFWREEEREKEGVEDTREES